MTDETWALVFSLPQPVLSHNSFLTAGNLTQTARLLVTGDLGSGASRLLLLYG